MLKCILLFVVINVIVYTQLDAQHSYVSKEWVADNGDGTFKNPILFADYSDPDAIRVGKDFYLVASSFNCIPGLPILHSRDLINWEIVNYGLKMQAPEAIYNNPQHGKGVWAPSIRYHNNEFYIFYPDPDYGVYMIKAKNPRSKWSSPVLVLSGKGIIDPCPLWDEDGSVYLVTAWAASRAGINSVLTLYKLNKAADKVIDEGKHIYDGHELDPTIEGPKLYKRNGYYYIFAPAGGVTNGWQTALRSKSIYGPYERKVVLDKGATNINGPHQGAWITTNTGEDWFLHFQDLGAYGRVLHLQPLQWKDNWPVIGIDKNNDGKGEPVLFYKKPNVGLVYPIQTPVESDEFNTDTLGLQWQWQANNKIQWSALMRKKGYLRLFAFPSDTGRNLWSVPNLLLQKLPAPSFTATVKIKYTDEWNTFEGKRAGLIIMGNDYACISISKKEAGYFVSQSVCKDASSGSKEDTIEQKELKSSEILLRIQVKEPEATCKFSFSEDGVNFQTIGSEFKAKPDKWVGAKVGMFCISKGDIRNGGYADIDWFRVSP